MQANSWHQLFHFYLPFYIWKLWKGREKIQTFEYLENGKSFLDEMKSIFHSFWGALLVIKIKIAGTSFKVFTIFKFHQIKENCFCLEAWVNFCPSNWASKVFSKQQGNNHFYWWASECYPNTTWQSRIYWKNWNVILKHLNVWVVLELYYFWFCIEGLLTLKNI